METFIYALIDPRNNFKIYIGKSNNPSKRLKEHLSRTRTKTKKNDWLNKLWFTMNTSLLSLNQGLK